MTDPLLTIEDATREFRVSPKTIRRRLADGAIAGAFKRPGSRGPEWVIPRSSLAAAGFAPRPRVDPAEIPEDPAEQSDYWRHRAIAAETALAGRGQETVAAPRKGLGGLGLLFVGLALVLAVVATVLAVTDGTESADPDVVPADPVTAALWELTDPGDSLGLVGTVSARYLPDGRVPVRVDLPQADATVPRYVITTSEATTEADDELIATLASTSRTVLSIERPGDGLVRIFDRAEPAADADEQADPAGRAAGPADPAPVDDATPSPPATAAPTPSAAPGDSQTAPSPSPAPETADVVEVVPGESFWSIAADHVRAASPDASDAEVADYWQQLIDQNVDRLVDPGNPDLLHVGQQLRLPPTP